MIRLPALILLFLLSSPIVLFAQKNNEGIYLTANDFNNEKVSYTKQMGEKYKLCLNQIFNTSTVKIIIDGSIIKLNKDSIFGYQDNENISYRFYNKTAYQIINQSKKILLYSLSSLGGYKNNQTITKYYFSVDANSNIYSLSKWNLKAAFPNDAQFHELLDIYFTSDNELLNYDNYYNTYKLNRVYQLSQLIINKIN